MYVYVTLHFPYCVYAGSYVVLLCFEITPEDDSNNITQCSHDDKPSTGMFTVSGAIQMDEKLFAQDVTYT